MRRLFILLTLLLILPLSALSAQVKGVRMWTAPDHTRLVFDIDRPAEHQVFSLANPQRLVVDFQDSRIGPKYSAKGLQDRHIEGLRHAHRSDGRLRVVMDLRQAVKTKAFLLAPNKAYGHRLVIDLYREEGDQKAGSSASRTAKPADTQATPRKPRVAKSEQDFTELRDVVVAVDAGHGGYDPGASGSVKGTREKDITLQIARRLKRQIDAQPGMRAILTRKGDYFVGLRQRMTIARANRADLFVSIHADAFRDKRVRGSSVYVLSSRGASSEAARWLAERENNRDADLVGEVGFHDMDPAVAQVVIDLSQTASQEASLSVARRVYQNLGKVGKVHGKRVLSAGFMVLKAPDIPSLLIETGFISNPREERNLSSPRYQEKMAKSVMSGIRQYFTEAPPPGTLLAKRERDNRPRKHVIVAGDTLSHIAQRYEVSLASLRNENRIKNDRRIHVGQVLRIPGT